MSERLEYWRTRLQRFADDECRGVSPLYETVSLAMSEDTELLDWMVSVIGPRARPTLPLAAVHYLLLGGVAGDGLERFYPNLTAAPDRPEDAYPAFRAFVLAQRPRLAPLLATRGTQTNEVGRCSYLLPAYVIVAQWTGRPIWLIDVGSSAGLTLLFDRYAYDYGEGHVAGDPTSPVRLRTAARGARVVAAPMPFVAGRVGIDLAPVSLDDADAVRWLEACVWPEHVERVRNLGAALDVARVARPHVVAGNAIDALPNVVAEADPAASLVIVNTNVLLYFSRDERARYAAQLAEVGSRRELFWIANEHPMLLREMGFAATLDASIAAAALPLAVSRFDRGHRADYVLGWVGPHARWLDWIGAPATAQRD